MAELADADARRKRAEADRFRLFAEFADEYRWVPEDGPVLAGTERLVHWGGEGTPGVAEFCTLEVAAALRMREEAVRAEIGAALAVRHRFPLVWGLTMIGQVRVWDAKQVAALTHGLSFEQGVELDAEIAPLARTMSATRWLKLVEARILELRAVEVQSEHEQALARRRVDFHQTGLGVTDVTGTLDAADGVFLDAQLERLASILGQGGNDNPLQVRRAQALGVLASPARALQLLQASLVDELPEIDEDCPARGQRGHTCGAVTVDPDRLLPEAELVVHLTDHTAEAGEGLVRVENMGPLLAGWVKDLVGHTRVNVRPVLDPEQLVPTDAYECPPRMREWVELRNPYEVFPFSSRTSKGVRGWQRPADMDHTIPWQPAPAGGPASAAACEGQPPTRPDNLGPLSRKVHRAKTHGGWQLAQPSPGVFLWRSPLGFGYLVTPSHSWMVDDPTGRILPPRREQGSGQGHGESARPCLEPVPVA